jgi:hypothetical protein
VVVIFSLWFVASDDPEGPGPLVVQATEVLQQGDYDVFVRIDPNNPSQPPRRVVWGEEGFKAACLQQADSDQSFPPCDRRLVPLRLTVS